MLETFTFIIALILIVLPIIDWYVAIKLYRVYKKYGSDNAALKERGIVAGILATASTLSASLAFVRLLDLHPGTPVTLGILSAILLLIGVPNLYWLLLYSRNQLRK